MQVLSRETWNVSNRLIATALLIHFTDTLSANKNTESRLLAQVVAKHAFFGTNANVKIRGRLCRRVKHSGGTIS